MQIHFQPPQPTSRLAFAVSSAATVVGGIGLLGLAIFWLRPIPTQPVKPPPPKQIEKIVTIVAPAPPPKIIYKEIIVEKAVEVPAPTPTPPPPPPPPTPTVEPPNPWVGVWKIPRQSLPVIDLRQRGAEFYGAYAPEDWSGTYAFKGGVLRDRKVEFEVQIPVYKAPQQIRMTMLPSGAVKVETWLKPQDALVMLTNAVTIAKTQPVTPAQRAALKSTLDREIKRLGTPVPLGTFSRVRDPGDSAVPPPGAVSTPPSPTKTPPAKQPPAPAGPAPTKRFP